MDDTELDAAIENALHSVYLAHDDAGNVIGHIGDLHDALRAELDPLWRGERVRASQLAARIDILEGQNMRLRESVSRIKQERMAAAARCGFFYPTRGNEMSALDGATDEELWAEVERRELANIVGYVDPRHVSEHEFTKGHMLWTRTWTHRLPVYGLRGGDTVKSCAAESVSSRAEETDVSAEPTVAYPMPTYGGVPPCPACGYRCGCCCYHDCQTPHLCASPDVDGDCDCGETCHGGHEPWDCWDFSTRYDWAKAKSDLLAAVGSGSAAQPKDGNE